MGNWSIRYLKHWPVLHVVRKRDTCNVHEQVQDQLFREDLSTVTGSGLQRRTEQCYRCFLSQLVNVWWREERKALVLCFFLFPHPCLLTYGFLHLSGWIWWWTGEPASLRILHVAKGNAGPHGWFCEQELSDGNQPRKCFQSSRWEQALSFPRYKNKSRTLVWVWEGHLCYRNCCVQICPQLSQQLWRVGPNPADTWNTMATKTSINQGSVWLHAKGRGFSVLFVAAEFPGLPVSFLPLWYKFTKQYIPGAEQGAGSQDWWGVFIQAREKKGINPDPPLEWVPCALCTRAVKDRFGTESIRTYRMELQKKHRPLIIFIFENYFREITHMSKIVRNAPPSTQLFC